MDNDYALAFALANDSLCFLAGAGLSKHLTSGAIPDWEQLLDTACDALKDSAKARVQLKQARSELFGLEDCAQMLELAFIREGLELRDTLAKIIASHSAHPVASASLKAFLMAHGGVRFITTNYDLLVESLVDSPATCNCNYPGRPVSRRRATVDVYHVHGCVLDPSAMVVSTADYYKWMNNVSYFSQKVATLLHENAVVILGYSLSDPNLKALLNEHRSTQSRTINRGSLYFVARKTLPGYVRDYYEAAYGISVIENTEVDALLAAVEAQLPEARKRVGTLEADLRNVLNGIAKWDDAFLKTRASLFHIVATADSIGIDVHSPPCAAMFEAILTKKVTLTKEDGAWSQYSHLADWLVYIASIMDIPGTPLEGPFLEAVRHSMTTMSKELYFGFSWNAFVIWNTNWERMTFKNRLLIRQFMEKKTLRADVLEVLMQ